jgi:hypothetical protein
MAARSSQRNTASMRGARRSSDSTAQVSTHPYLEARGLTPATLSAPRFRGRGNKAEDRTARFSSSTATPAGPADFGFTHGGSKGLYEPCAARRLSVGDHSTWHRRSQQPLSNIYLPPEEGFGMGVEFEQSQGGCVVGFDVARPLDDWPIWPWIVEGAQVDISLWDTGTNLRGGDSLWMIARASDANVKVVAMRRMRMQDSLGKGHVPGQLGALPGIRGKQIASSPF